MSFLRALAVLPWLVSLTVLGPAAVAPASPVAPTAVVPAASDSAERDAPATIDATGQRDVTAALQTFLDGVPNGGVARLKQDGDYRVEGTLALTDRSNFKLDGNGARVFATVKGDRERAHLRVVRGSHLVIHDLDIGGPNTYAGLDERAYRPEAAFQHGISLDGATDVEVVRVRVHDVYGDLLYIGASPDRRWSERIWIHDSVFARSGRQGLTVTAGRNVVIEDNTVTDTRRATFDLEPNGQSGGAENVWILDNQIGAGRLLFLAAAGAGPVNQVVVARNRLQGRTLGTVVRPPGGDRRRGFYIIDNVSNLGAKSPAFHVNGVDGFVVTGNTQPTITAGVPLVDATGVCSLVVTGNNLRPAGTVELASATAPCGATPSTDAPAPPAVAGRPVSGAGTAATATPSTTAPTSIPATRPALTEISSDDGGIGWIGIALVVLVALALAAALIRWVVLSERRAKQRGGPRTSPPSRPR